MDMTTAWKRGGRRGFTLVEILVVVAIIIILASIVVAIGRGTQGNVQSALTKQTMATLKGILEQYEQEVGKLPMGDPKAINANVYQTNWRQTGKNTPAMNMFTQLFNSDVGSPPGYVVDDVVLERVLDGGGVPAYMVYSATSDNVASPGAGGPWTPAQAKKVEGQLLVALQNYEPTRKALLEKIPAEQLRMEEVIIEGVRKSMVVAVNDGYGKPIGYVPRGVARTPFFVSGGPDLIIDSRMYIGSNDKNGDKYNDDNIYSYD